MQQRLGEVATGDGSVVAYATAGTGRTLVRYDRIGCGLSSPLNPAPSLDFELEQLGAVVAALGTGPFAAGRATDDARAHRRALGPRG